MSAALLGSLLALLSAASSEVFPVSGRLTTSEGRPVNAAYEVRFELLASASATTPLWTETQSVTFSGGFFTAYLGSVTPLTPALLRDERDLFLRIVVDGDAMEPFPLGAVPYAATARLADEARTLDGQSRDDIVESLAEVARSGAFADLVDVPPGLADGDDDLLATLPCAEGQIVRRIAGAYGCTADLDTLGSLVCQNGQLARWNGFTWGCSTELLATIACTPGSLLGFETGGYQCIPQYSAAAPLLVGPGNELRLGPGGITDSHVSATAAIAPAKIAGTAATLTGTQLFDLKTLVIDADTDRVGVGTLSPGATLEVAGTVRATAFEFPGRLDVRLLPPAAFLSPGYVDATTGVALKSSNELLGVALLDTASSALVTTTAMFALRADEELRRVSCFVFDNQVGWDLGLTLDVARRATRVSTATYLGTASVAAGGTTTGARAAELFWPAGAMVGGAEVFVVRVLLDRRPSAGGGSNLGLYGFGGCEYEVFTTTP